MTNEKWNNIFTANIFIFVAWLVSIIVSFISVGLIIGIVASTPGNSGGDVVNEILGIIRTFFASTMVSITSVLFWFIGIVSSIAEIVFAAIAISNIKVYREANKMNCFWMTIIPAAISLFVIVLYRLVPLTLLLF